LSYLIPLISQCKFYMYPTVELTLGINAFLMFTDSSPTFALTFVSNRSLEEGDFSVVGLNLVITTGIE
ncbi:MAG: hypothetical protein J7L77_00745, partial [Clostridiales bacterium]|nr:hypothetical protein [Clostridiales bacterium]